jgi:hypothetical protein
MNGMTDSIQVQRINALCHPLLRYLHKLSGVRYLAVYETAGIYELNPIFGKQKHATITDLADAEVWERLE